jgi:hypothetical protein
MKKMIARLTSILLLNVFCLTAIAQKDIYEIRVYQLKSADQVNATDSYLKDLPACHAPVGSETDRRI